MSSFEVIVIGAGFAGAATARALVQAGVKDVLVLDAERAPGVHSSGRNAGMVRRGVEDGAIAPLAREGAHEILRLGVPYRRCGSFLLGGHAHVPPAVRAGFRHRRVAADEAVERVPLLTRARTGDVLEALDDGIVEVHALLAHYLEEVRDGGGTVRFGVAAAGPRLSPARSKPAPAGRRVVGIDATDGPILCRHLVVASGAWAGQWGERAGVPVRMVPRRRHIVVTRAPADVSTAGWPWVWDLDHQLYFRPESAGLLWSPCDSEVDRPGPAVADPDVVTRLAEKVAPLLPWAAELAVVRHWAGHRTFTPDGRFLLGPDPRLDGWHWAAALGGHGVTVSAAVGRRVAGALLGALTVEPEHAVRPAVLGSHVRDESEARAVSP